ncbi:fluoride efflux transporter CrcB [Metabacillus sp. 84]|uniref:fluoride efflux transporter CrcB n=1 Tax=Metabacillus sp. 84 TaxID=3404705 RepID=UPI003CEDE4C6
MNYLAIGIAGAAGSILRYLTGLAGNASAFPAGTFTANMIGCFLLSFLTAGVFRLDKFPKQLAAPIGTGLIGSYTTFSAFSVEAVQLLEKGKLGIAVLYVLSSAILGFLFASAGFIMGKKLSERQPRL